MASSSWSTQATSNSPDFSSSTTILDHDTLVLFTLTGTSINQLDLSKVTQSATSDVLAWENGANNEAPFTSSVSRSRKISRPCSGR